MLLASAWAGVITNMEGEVREDITIEDGAVSLCLYALEASLQIWNLASSSAGKICLS